MRTSRKSHRFSHPSVVGDTAQKYCEPVEMLGCRVFFSSRKVRNNYIDGGKARMQTKSDLDYTTATADERSRSVSSLSQSSEGRWVREDWLTRSDCWVAASPCPPRSPQERPTGSDGTLRPELSASNLISAPTSHLVSNVQTQEIQRFVQGWISTMSIQARCEMMQSRDKPK